MQKTKQSHSKQKNGRDRKSKKLSHSTEFSSNSSLSSIFKTWSKLIITTGQLLLTYATFGTLAAASTTVSKLVKSAENSGENQNSSSEIVTTTAHDNNYSSSNMISSSTNEHLEKFIAIGSTLGTCIVIILSTSIICYACNKISKTLKPNYLSVSDKPQEIEMSVIEPVNKNRIEKSKEESEEASDIRESTLRTYKELDTKITIYKPYRL